MLKFKRGNVFDVVEGQPIFATMSSFIKKDGSALMSRGAALGCLRKFDGIDFSFGELIRKYGVVAKNDRGNRFLKYGCIYVPEQKVGAFQIKYHMNDNPDFELIRYSANMLTGLARTIQPLHINFPGLGKNTENRAELYKLLEGLWKNVDITLWRLDTNKFQDDEEFYDEEEGDFDDGDFDDEEDGVDPIRRELKDAERI